MVRKDMGNADESGRGFVIVDDFPLPQEGVFIKFVKARDWRHWDSTLGS